MRDAPASARGDRRTPWSEIEENDFPERIVRTGREDVESRRSRTSDSRVRRRSSGRAERRLPAALDGAVAGDHAGHRLERRQLGGVGSSPSGCAAGPSEGSSERSMTIAGPPPGRVATTSPPTSRASAGTDERLTRMPRGQRSSSRQRQSSMLARTRRSRRPGQDAPARSPPARPVGSMQAAQPGMPSARRPCGAATTTASASGTGSGAIGGVGILGHPPRLARRTAGAHDPAPSRRPAPSATRR